MSQRLPIHLKSRTSPAKRLYKLMHAQYQYFLVREEILFFCSSENTVTFKANLFSSTPVTDCDFKKMY